MVSEFNNLSPFAIFLKLRFLLSLMAYFLKINTVSNHSFAPTEWTQIPMDIKAEHSSEAFSSFLLLHLRTYRRGASLAYEDYKFC
jgi:hypothetical protein